MKNTLYRTKIGLAFVTASLLKMVSCTGDFEHFDTDPNSAQQIDPVTWHVPIIGRVVSIHSFII